MATIEPNFESICIDPNDDLVLYKKEIVRSTIEKFLYAICSLDNDDLPTPLSRIEEMYKCLVTGADFITFTPLSRAEKFVMAMLGAYDVELLPTPISRSETLMKKIATGDNNLDDVDNLQSRYEFLLAYIIKAGGFNGGSEDFYYNLTSLTSDFTTIYDTIDMPVKNAVLRGQTLVNLVGTYKYTISTVNKPIVWGQKRLFLTNIKPNTRYTLKVKMTEVVKGNYGPRVQIFFTTYSTGEINTATSTSDTLIFTSPAELSSDAHLRLIVTGSEAEATEVDFEILLLEGEHPDIKDIPYFDYMQSVKMPVLTTTGKNLYPYGDLTLNDPKSNVWYYTNGTGAKFGSSCKRTDGGNWFYLEKGVYSYQSINENALANLVLIGEGEKLYNSGTEIPSGWYVFRFKTISEPIDYVKISQIQLEKGSNKTTYEPYKTNILTCNEEVELRGISNGSNRFEDELNLVTGELTQRVGEIVLDGSEKWEIREFNTTNTECVIFTMNINDKLNNWIVISDKFIYTGIDIISANNIEGIYTGGKSYSFFINVSKTKASTVEEFKNWLSNNNVTIQYPLIESVKTVDLSTLDQDGKETELNTFDDITHIMASSEGLVPTGDIYIARPIQFVDYSLDNGLTTLYNTIEYPVKSAVLKGNTLVNIIKKPTYENIGANKDWYTQGSGIVTYSYDANKGVTVVNSVDGSMVLDYLDLTLFKPNTEYTLFIDVTWSGVGRAPMLMEITNQAIDLNNGLNIVKFTSVPDLTIPYMCFRLGYTGTVEVGCEYTFNNIMVLEGDWTNVDIPYFEGMASVKMPVLKTTGKNLFDKNKKITNDKRVSTNNGFLYSQQGYSVMEYFEINPNTTYTLTHDNRAYCAEYDEDKNFIRGFGWDNGATITTQSNTRYIRIDFPTDKIDIVQIEKGSTTTSFEPFKSNILTCNEEVELRGIGDIKDELNLVTGELTQYVGAITIDDSYSWRLNTGMNGEQETHLVFQSNYNFSDYKYVASNLNIINNKFSLVGFGGNANKAGEWLTIGSNGLLYVKINKNKLDTHDIDGFKKWLVQNPIIVQYELATKSIKTIDLSTLDQDDKETELSTFDDITHVTVSSEELIPMGEITVATKDATDVIEASVMSLRMNDILNSQRTLEGSANTQSDDIDVAMLGTTDIYEQLL